MFINKLNQLYKQKRILYYQEASKEQIDAFYHGVIPEKIAVYQGAFGTYDIPGCRYYVKKTKFLFFSKYLLTYYVKGCNMHTCKAHEPNKMKGAMINENKC